MAGRWSGSILFGVTVFVGVAYLHLSWMGLRSVTYVLVILTKWFSLPRLETRTKESNICASTEVANLRA